MELRGQEMPFQDYVTMLEIGIEASRYTRPDDAAIPRSVRHCLVPFLALYRFTALDLGRFQYGCFLLLCPIRIHSLLQLPRLKGPRLFLGRTLCAHLACADGDADHGLSRITFQPAPGPCFVAPYFAGQYSSGSCLAAVQGGGAFL